MPIVYGNGFGVTHEAFPISPNPRAFYWGGWGGPLALIDLDARVSIAYAMNKMDANLARDVRGGVIVAGV